MAKIIDYGPEWDRFKEEYAEEARNEYAFTNWPKPLGRMRFEYENFRQSMEEVYYWVVTNLMEQVNYPVIEKLADVFAASEFSSFFGATEQKLGLQQDKASQFLATIGKMVKELFQLVRELRVLDERLELYKTSYEGSESSEIALKGYWIDMAEQGAKNPGSVYGMSREIQFTALPDVFFSVHPQKQEEIDAAVDPLEFNPKLKIVLKRKLKKYLIWKAFTHDEMNNRRKFTLKYLRQHYEIIKMYMLWVRPYLKNIRRLIQDTDKKPSPHLIAAFEGSLIEIELLARKPIEDGKLYFCMDIHFLYRTRPEMLYHQEYQKGPLHLGRTMMTVRTYLWTMDHIEQYKKFRTRDDFDLLSLVDESVNEAMTSLGDELEKYLVEAGEEELAEFRKKGEVKIISRPSVLEPFTSLLKVSPKRKVEKNCPGCGAPKTGYYKCLRCNTRWRAPTKKELFELSTTLKEDALKLYENDFHFINRRFKAEHGMIY